MDKCPSQPPQQLRAGAFRLEVGDGTQKINTERRLIQTIFSQSSVPGAPQPSELCYLCITCINYSVNIFLYVDSLSLTQV